MYPHGRTAVIPVLVDREAQCSHFMFDRSAHAHRGRSGRLCMSTQSLPGPMSAAAGTLRACAALRDFAQFNANFANKAPDLRPTEPRPEDYR